MEVKQLYDHHRKKLRQILDWQFKRIDSDNDGFITREDLERHFSIPAYHSDIIFRGFAFKNSSRMSRKRFISKFLKLVKVIY